MCLFGEHLFLQTSPLVSCTACAGAGFAGDRSDVLLDLYSGTGTIALCLASRCKKVYGVESNQHAVDDAMENARYNCKTNAIFLQADLSKDEDMAHVAQHVPRPDIVVAGTSRFCAQSASAVFGVVGRDEAFKLLSVPWTCRGRGLPVATCFCCIISLVVLQQSDNSVLRPT